MGSALGSSTLRRPPSPLNRRANRIATSRSLPVIFTHHTRYEDYVHYMPINSPAVRRAAIQLSTEYANLCDGVIAPSASIARLIRRRGVTTPIRVVPTGVDTAAFAAGVGERARRRWKIPPGAFVVGHVGLADAGMADGRHARGPAPGDLRVGVPAPGETRSHQLGVSHPWPSNPIGLTVSRSG